MSGTVAYLDYRWEAPAADMETALRALGWVPAGEQASGPRRYDAMIGPRTLDGRSYVAVRSSEALDLPAGLSVTGPELSVALLGVWM